MQLKMRLDYRKNTKFHAYKIFLNKVYFTKFSLNTVSIRVKFGSSKEKITTRRMYIYLIPDTKAVITEFSVSMCLFMFCICFNLNKNNFNVISFLFF